tara:strand:- start:295 stop:885 length:591 start_codon:yes stop_codon:yes gene_type:complete
MAFATIDVTKGITGTIPVANGGTGLTSGTTDQFLKFTGTTTIASAADNAGAVVQRVMTQKQKIPSDIVTSSTSFESSGIEVTITPTSASNMIDVYFVCTMTTSQSSDEGNVMCYVNDANASWQGSDNTPSGNFWQVAYKVDAYNKYAPIVWTGRYDPTNTSALKFTIYFRRESGSNDAVRFHGSSSYFLSATEVTV